jgi:hypothetical protein
LTLKNAVVDFEFRFDGGTGLSLVFNDRDYKDSHAGHICRASVSLDTVRLGDDREGTMKFGIYERWKDPEKRAGIEPLVADKTTKTPIKLDEQKWYRMTVEIVGDEMVASLDGKPVAYLKSPGIAHPTKTDWGFTTQKRWIEIDNLRVYQAEPDAAWPARRAALFGASAVSK